jgi:hypothetical protein
MGAPPPTAIPNELLVRQHQRYTCSLHAKVRVPPPDATQITFARAVGDGAGTINATVVDCSSGGLGLQMAVYLPRGCRVHVRVPAGPGEPDLFNGELRAQRVTMIDRNPTYYLGGAMVPSSGTGVDSAANMVNRLLEHIRQTGGTGAQ